MIHRHFCDNWTCWMNLVGYSTWIRLHCQPVSVEQLDLLGSIERWQRDRRVVSTSSCSVYPPVCLLFSLPYLDRPTGWPGRNMTLFELCSLICEFMAQFGCWSLLQPFHHQLTFYLNPVQRNHLDGYSKYSVMFVFSNQIIALFYRKLSIVNISNLFVES